MRARIACSLTLVVLVLAAVGCGGSDDEADPTAAWASGFCAAVTTWTDALQDVTSQFNDTSNFSEEGLRDAADDVKGSTQQLVDDLRALGAPETDSGEEIRSSLDSLATTLETEADEIESTVDGVSGLTEIPGAISTLTASLSAMGSAFSATLQAIDEADVDSELQSALEDSPDCADITS